MSFSAKALPDDPGELETWITGHEMQTSHIKKNASARIVWADSQRKEQTDYAIVYLHGFKASHGEGDPIHRQVARALNCNLYLSRLEGHGLDISEPLKNISALSFEQSAIKALAIGEKIGKKVIIMGASTGGSLGLFLAGHPKLKATVAALILYSPLIKFYGMSQYFLGNRFSRKIMKVIPGKHYMLTAELGSTKQEEEIWYHTYALQGALALGEFIQKSMNTETFSKVTCPVFCGYYFKNEEEQDTVVSVSAIKNMFHEIATKKSQKILKNFPGAGTHVICSGLVSNSIKQINRETLLFLKDTLSLSIK